MRLPLLLLTVCFLGHSTWAKIGSQTEDCDLSTNTVNDDGTGILNPRIDNDLGSRSGSGGCRQRSAAVTCGHQKPRTVPRFTKAKASEADPGEFPWVVSLLAKLKCKDTCKDRFEYIATGSLIHDRVVLTAAHAMNNKDVKLLRAVIGDHDLNKKVLRKKLVEVKEVVIHNEFDSGTGNYNFALVFLSGSALKELRNAGTVCLPPANYVSTTGSSCIFSGWGLNSAGIMQNQLTKTEMPMMDHSACEKRLQQNPSLGPGFSLFPSLICAGGDVGRDICEGAGGSPLACPIEGQKGRYVQTGIVSWVTTGCGVDGSPAVYANVAMARTWIDQKLSEHGYTTESYTY